MLPNVTFSIPAEHIDRIEAGLQWSEPIEHTAPNGKRYTVRQASPSREFWKLWELCKQCAQDAGFRVFRIDGQWTVSKLASAFRSTAARTRIIADEPARVAHQPPTGLGALPAGDPRLPIPLPPGKALLPFQAEDVRRMMAMRSVLLASDMGTGKTPTMIALANAVAAERVLIVCPARVVGNWLSELSAWSTLPVEPINIAEATATDVRNGAILVGSYEAATRRAEWLRSIEWDVVAFDEAHFLASHESQRAAALIGDGGIRATYRILASGSPIPNKLYGMWPLLDYLQPGAWGTAHEFGVRYGGGYFDAGAGPRGAWVYKGATHLPELNARLRASLMIRRTKDAVLSHLPSKSHRLVLLTPTEEQAKLVADEARLAKIDPDDIARGLGNVELGADENLATVRAKLAETKFDAIVEHVQSLVDRGEPVVVFGHHRRLLDRLARYWGRAAVSIVGGQGQEGTTKAVKAFQTDDRVMVCVVSIRAGSAGLTLTRAAHAVFAEADWSAAVVDQASDRIHRLGQTRPCTIWHLAIEGSADALVYMVGARKRKNARQALA